MVASPLVVEDVAVVIESLFGHRMNRVEIRDVECVEESGMWSLGHFIVLLSFINREV